MSDVHLTGEPGMVDSDRLLREAPIGNNCLKILGQLCRIRQFPDTKFGGAVSGLVDGGHISRTPPDVIEATSEYRKIGRHHRLPINPTIKDEFVSDQFTGIKSIDRFKKAGLLIDFDVTDHALSCSSLESGKVYDVFMSVSTNIIHVENLSIFIA